jgi:hypothetical protein
VGALSLAAETGGGVTGEHAPAASSDPTQTAHTSGATFPPPNSSTAHTIPQSLSVASESQYIDPPTSPASEGRGVKDSRLERRAHCIVDWERVQRRHLFHRWQEDVRVLVGKVERSETERDSNDTRPSYMWDR